MRSTSLVPGSRRPRRRRCVLAASLAAGILAGAFAAVTPPAAAADHPIVIDDFAGRVHGTRTVSVLPRTADDTTVPGGFAQSGGYGSMTMSGAGDSAGGVQLDYSFGSTDVSTASGAVQLSLEFSSIARLPIGTAGETAADIAVEATDATGATGTYRTDVANVSGFNLDVSLSCGPSLPCLRPSVDPTAVTHLRVRVSYPQAHDPTGALTAVLDTIRTSAVGEALPHRPTAAVSRPPGDPAYAVSGSSLAFDVAFRRDGRPAPVTHTPGTADGLRAEDIDAAGTAAGSSSVSVSGGPADYTVDIGPLTSSGTVTVGIPAGVVSDAWGQPNLAAEPVSVDFVVAEPPQLSGDVAPGGSVGSVYLHQFTAGGTPAATYDVSAGSLPPGLSLSRSGALTGIPTAGGLYAFTVGAANPAGSVTQPVSLPVAAPPEITSPATASFSQGSNGSFTVTTGGYPLGRITASALPAGLSFTDRGDGTATIGGTPVSPGITAATLTLANGSGVVNQQLTINVNARPVITSADQATFTVGVAGSFDVTTSGATPAAVSVMAGTLPAGLTLTDNGDGTARISGTTTASGGPVSVVLSASSSAGTSIQVFTAVVNAAPAFTSEGSATFTVGTAGSLTVRADGFPHPVISAVTALPAGLTLVDNGDGTARIAGTATAPGGTSVLTLSATSSLGSDTQNLRVAVNEAPSFRNVGPATFTIGDAGSYQVTVSGSPAAVITAGSLPPGLRFTDAGDGTGIIHGTPTGSGSSSRVTLIATNPIGHATQNLEIRLNQAPAVTTGNSVRLTMGAAASFRVSAGGYPAPAILNDGDLPAGLTLADNADGTATISGTPTGPGGVSSVTLRATNVAGSAEQVFTIVLRAAPAFTSTGPLTFTAGVSGTYDIAATGYPVPKITADALPRGLRLRDNGDGTATISGKPTGPAATRTVTLTATNRIASTTRGVVLVVDTAPVFVGAPEADFDLGAVRSLTVVAHGDPAPAISAADSLPAGLTLTDLGGGRAVLAGTPTIAGEYPVTFSAANSAGTTDQVMSILIASAPRFTSPATGRLAVGRAGTFSVRTTGVPVPTLALRGDLPAGVSFSDNGNGTATIGGTPTAGSSSLYPVTVTAVNSAPGPTGAGGGGEVERSATQHLVILVQPASTVSLSTAEAAGAALGGMRVRPSWLPGTGGPALWTGLLGLVLIAVGATAMALRRHRVRRR